MSVNMKAKQLKKNYPLLKILEKTSLKRQPAIIQHLSSDTLGFLLESLSCILHNHPRFHLSTPEKHLAKTVLSPYIKPGDLKCITSKARRPASVKQIQLQRGRGILLTALLSAVVPLISGLVGKLFKKKKEKK